MFYGQNCSGRFGDNRSIISVVGSREDINFVKLLNELKLRKIKQNLNQKYFSKATEIAKVLEEKTNCTVIIWLGSAWGACDIPVLDVDLLIQWGHSEWDAL